MKITASTERFVTTCIEVIFPPSEDELLFRAAGDTLPEITMIHIYEHFSFLLPYKTPVVRATIHLNKFHYHRKAQRILARVLDTQLKEKFRDHLIIPIPLSGKRYRERGYNQVTAVLQHLSHYEQQHTLLRRTRHTTPQSDLQKKERLTNMQNAFQVMKPTTIEGRHILLVDDVVTTGATLHAARAALAPHSPASITCLALAH